MFGKDFIKNKKKDEIDKRKNSRILILVFSVMTSIVMLLAFVYINSVILNHKIEATTSGSTTHTLNPNSTAVKAASNKTATQIIKENANKTKNNSTTNSSSQPNSNVSRLTTTQGNVTTNANAPGSHFPPKQANSTTYFPESNKVAIVVGAALLRDKAYQPNPITVKTGGIVTWNNDDTVVHTVTSGAGLQDPKLGNEFDSGLLGGHFSHIFFKPGTFPYFCQIHPTMVGKIIVK